MTEFLFDLTQKPTDKVVVGFGMPVTTGQTREGLLDPVELPASAGDITVYGLLVDHFRKATHTTNGSVKVFQNERATSRHDHDGWHAVNGHRVTGNLDDERYVGFEVRLDKPEDLVAVAGIYRAVSGSEQQLTELQVTPVEGLENRFVFVDPAEAE